MPTARIISSEPQRAAQIAQSLAESGFDVRVVSPLEPQDSDCDLEIDLDQMAGAELNFVVEYATAYFRDNKEPKIEREFVLAPAWRSCKQKLGGLRGAISARFAIAQPNNEQPVAGAFRTRAESWRTTLGGYARRSGNAVRGLRQRLELEKRLANAKGLVRRAAQRIAPNVDTFAQSMRERTAGMRSRTSLSGRAGLRWLADCWLRPSFSIAAGMVLAFFLGFWAAKAAKKASSEVSNPTMVEASVSESVLASPSSVEVSAPRKTTVKKKAISTSTRSDDFEEVVVRRYPQRQEVAETKPSPKKVKQYSDLDD
jgi:hypothetical protein